MDAISLLKQDHQTVERLFKRFEATSDSATVERRRIVDEIIRELSVHAEIEETVFYPAVREAVPPTEDDVLEALEEHHIVKWVLSELDGMAPDAERFEAKVTVLMENVRHHVEEEESELFPKVQRTLSSNALNEMGDALARAKTVAPTRPHPRSPDTPPGNIVTGVVAAALDRARDAGQDFVQNATGAARRVTGGDDGGPAPRKRSAAKKASGRKATGKRTAKKATGSTRKTVKAAGRTTKASARKASGTATRTAKKASGTTKRTARKATGSARKATSTATRTTRKATGAAKASGTTKRSTKKATGTTKRSTKKATGTTKRTAKKATGTTTKRTAEQARRTATRATRTAKKATRTAQQATRTAKKAARTADKATRSTKSTARKATGTARKTTGAARKTTSRPRKAAKKRS